MKQQLQSSPRIWTVPFVLVILISLASTGIVEALQAALPVLIRKSGGSSTLGGLTATVFALAAIVPSMSAGTLADSYGCRRIMLIGAANATCCLCVNPGFGIGALCSGIAIDFPVFDHALCAGTAAAVIPAVLGILFLRQEPAETK